MSKPPRHHPLPGDAQHLKAFSQRLTMLLNMRRLLGKPIITQADVHRELDSIGVSVSDGTVSRWFQGKFWPSEPRSMLGLAQVLEVDPAWLYFAEYSSASAPEELVSILSRR